MRGRGIKGVTYTNDQIRAEAMDSEAIKRLLFAEKISECCQISTIHRF
jgi:hypothetical protein